VPVAAGAATTAMAHGNGSGNGHGNGSGHGDGSGNGQGNSANGHKTEPAWLQRLKAGRFEED